MLINPSGLPGHAMGIDLNIEHLIRYLKVCKIYCLYCLLNSTSQALFAAKGIYSNWDRLGNIAAGIEYLQNIKKRVSKSVKAGYQGTTHTAVDTSALVWRISNKARELQLQTQNSDRNDNEDMKAVKDLQLTGYEMFSRNSLATFNKKITNMKEGLETPDSDNVIEADEMAPVNLELNLEPSEENEQEEVSVLHDETD